MSKTILVTGAAGFIGSYLMARDDAVVELGRRYQSSVNEEGQS